MNETVIIKPNDNISKKVRSQINSKMSMLPVIYGILGCGMMLLLIFLLWIEINSQSRHSESVPTGVLIVSVIVGLAIGFGLGYAFSTKIKAKARIFFESVSRSKFELTPNGIKGYCFNKIETTTAQNKSLSVYSKVLDSELISVFIDYAQINSVYEKRFEIGKIDYGYTLNIASNGVEYMLFCMDNGTAENGKNAIMSQKLKVTSNYSV